MQVLIVDDHEPMRAVIREGLRQFGLVRVFEAEDGCAALDLMARESFDLILSDLDMPRMNGLAFLEAVRADGGARRIPFVVVTGGAGANDVSLAEAFDVDGVVAEPFSLAGLARPLEPIIAAMIASKAAAPPQTRSRWNLARMG